MNYLAHGYRFLDDPYFVAGTAIPDWLSVVDRKMRVRSKAAVPFVDDDDARLASVARGIVQHHADDQWFHGSLAFTELSLQFTVMIRDALPRDDGFRPSFLGHILVELLLDDTLAQDESALLDNYYRVIASASPDFIQDVVNRLSARSSDRIGEMIGMFCKIRFLYDYADDEKLLGRINNVMKRANLAIVPRDFIKLLPDARLQVRQRLSELLPQAQN